MPKAAEKYVTFNCGAEISLGKSQLIQELIIQDSLSIYHGWHTFYSSSLLISLCSLYSHVASKKETALKTNLDFLKYFH